MVADSARAILPFRPAQSARKYQHIWTAEGSPLLAISRRQATAVATCLAERHPGPVRVVVGMRYGNPSIAAGLAELRAAGVQRLLTACCTCNTPPPLRHRPLMRSPPSCAVGAGCRNCASSPITTMIPLSGRFGDQHPRRSQGPTRRTAAVLFPRLAQTHVAGWRSLPLPVS